MSNRVILSDKILNIEQLKASLDAGMVLALVGCDDSAFNGKEIRAYCPIHCGDKQRSLYVDVLKKVALCHACEFSGDLIELYSQATNKPFGDAVKELASRVGFELEYSGGYHNGYTALTATSH